MRGRSPSIALLLLCCSMGCRPEAPDVEPRAVELISQPEQAAPVRAVNEPEEAAPEDPFDGFDTPLAKEITAWKKGMAPPAGLLRFPHPPLPNPFECGLSSVGSRVSSYISRIVDQDLLEALLLNPRADHECVKATSSRLLDLRGVKSVRELLEARRGQWTHQPEVTTLAQLLTCPFARIKVAAIDKKTVDRETAEKSLAALKTDLVRGETWSRAYRRASEQIPQAGGMGTHLGYRYDGLVSPTGFDLLTRYMATELPFDHLRAIFAAKGGTHVFETADAYWLYHVESFSE